MASRLYQTLLESSSQLVVAIGPAGTGKTFIPSRMAAAKLKNGSLKKLIITRPAVTVDEQHGFLPGTIEQKMQPWTQPILEHIKDRSRVEICPLAYMRGRTFDDAWIIADEMQNATENQMKMALTRIGYGSKMIITGDLTQNDIPNNGLVDLVRRMDPKYLVKFTHDDIVRSEIVREILTWYS